MPTTVSATDFRARLTLARKVLGLSPRASLHDLREAYRRLSRRHHPDRREDSDRVQANEEMQHLNQAYRELKTYMESYPVPLDPDPLENPTFDPEAWWRERFAESWRSE